MNGLQKRIEVSGPAVVQCHHHRLILGARVNTVFEGAPGGAVNASLSKRAGCNHKFVSHCYSPKLKRAASAVIPVVFRLGVSYCCAQIVVYLASLIATEAFIWKRFGRYRLA
ncbi:hypothetical protein J051_1297 [Klebsiella pneumoniae 440_1540]|nr:hypothetical protein H231_1750 [Klebsiella pneumoniae UHKPC01]EOY96422.1 hypothetical protein H236_1476 [Klebsiella pneumoniae UHKPC26]EOZ05423.1 hypothetical protein H233_1617 [Klebsiella pneumoniae UHKPC27]EOZ21955.1 hypothetical protein H243_1363 [Klebsiella pneumoniae UHKPC04]EOZ71834.1 hypothetical protein J051_1297 [Klebsiella pneumoniae 440_1540]EPB06123.1 hypothetical protein H210_0891 [Klebsiella pneumoniae UHKPC05]EPB21706.1 hypothetical protein H241_1652 [Klebsiella pneumoniae U